MKKRMTLCLLACFLLFFAAQGTAQTAQVRRSALTDTVYGAGSIQPLSQPGIYASATGTVAECFVSMGDEVRQGDILLRLENDALSAEIAQLEYDLQIARGDLSDVETHSQYTYRQLKDEAGELRYDVNTGEPLMGKYSNEITIRAPGDGRVMDIRIAPGDEALAVYRELGYVMMLSTDGRMKVELESEQAMPLELNDTVRVTGEGVEAEGKVVSLTRRGTQAVIQVGSDDYPMGAQVAVTREDGAAVGSGTLEINKPLAVSAYGGRIKGIEYGVKVGAYVEREDVLARIEWDDIPLHIDNDSALRTYAKAGMALAQARESLEYLVVTAPCDGVIVSIDVAEGDSVEDGAKLGSMLERTGMQVILTVDELDIVRVVPGQRVALTADALAGLTIEGTVRKIAPIGNTETSVTTYDVYVDVNVTDDRVLGGMNVSGEIVIDTLEDVLVVPTDALRKDGEGWYVRMQDGEERRVVPGVMTDAYTQVTDGLREGETIEF